MLILYFLQNSNATMENKIIPNHNVLKYYFYFIQERMNIFWRKCLKYSINDATQDSILKEFKFTNVYRASDRVSQYLINMVIYGEIKHNREEDLLLQIIVFKIFNKISTWEFLKHAYGDISIDHFDVEIISKLLTERQVSFPIFNNAYMMTGSHHKYNHLNTKHEKWLSMVKKEILDAKLLSKIVHAHDLSDVFNLLNQCSFLGPFLSYQYAIDLNYSPVLNFNENSFVKAGIGAIRGIKKCFLFYGDHYEDAIFYIQNNFEELQQKYGYSTFRELPGRMPTLIDLQNCFCETDKYLRMAMPELHIGNKRIKQRYLPSNAPIKYKFPPKWHINLDKKLCIL